MAKHLAELDRALTAIATGSIKRLIVEMPPRHGKSELTSKYFPSWYLGTYPERNIILTSATDELALDFSAAGRDLLLEHGGLFGVGMRSDVQARHRWQLDRGGMVRAAGVGGAIMGRGADLIIVDDFHKNVEEALSETTRRAVHQWFMSTASTRLTPNGAIVVVATRWHPDDLIGRLLKEQESGGDVYTRIRFPCLAEGSDVLGREFGGALWPEQFSLDWCTARRQAYIASGYEWMWEALYQQNPPTTLNAEFPPEYFPEAIWFDDWPEDRYIVNRVMACDPSLGKSDKSDYSAMILLAKDIHGVYWVDADLARRPSTKIVKDAIAHYKAFRPVAFGCETNQFQELLREQFEREAWAAGCDAWACGIHNSIAKPTRIRSLTPILAQGKLRIKRGSPGASLLLEQLRGFPSSKYDDGPDALEMAVRLCEQLLAGAVVENPEFEERVTT